MTFPFLDTSFYCCTDFIFSATFVIFSERMQHSEGPLGTIRTDRWNLPGIRTGNLAGGEWKAARIPRFLRKGTSSFSPCRKGRRASLQKDLCYQQSKAWHCSFPEENVYSKSADPRWLRNACKIPTTPHLVTFSKPTYGCCFILIHSPISTWLLYWISAFLTSI